MRLPVQAGLVQGYLYWATLLLSSSDQEESVTSESEVVSDSESVMMDNSSDNEVSV